MTISGFSRYVLSCGMVLTMLAACNAWTRRRRGFHDPQRGQRRGARNAEQGERDRKRRNSNDPGWKWNPHNLLAP